MRLHKTLFSRNFFLFNLVLMGAIFGFSLAFLSFSCAAPSGKNTVHAEELPRTVPTDALAVAESLQTVFRSISDSALKFVVEVNVVEVKKQQTPQFDGIPWEFFFGQPNQQGDGKGQEREFRSRGLGSGIIVRKVGNTYYVLTNNHVAGEATEITLKFSDGRELPAKLVGKDPRKDLALVSFESKDSFPLALLGDSETIRVGDWAIAVGNPLGLVSSVTMGIVSAIGRTGGPAGNINDFIQTDAAINQGNSGGALVNIRGEVIGINTWIASPSGGSVGLGFAIPINNAKKAIDDFINSGQVRYGWLGVSLIEADKEAAKDLGVEGKKGAFVSQLFIGSPADKGGMKSGDFVIELNGKPVMGKDQLVLSVGDLKAGDSATFGIIRAGKKMDVKVRIEERKDAVAADNAKLWPGTVVFSITEELRKSLSIAAGLKGVVAGDVIAKSAASVMGVQRGDVITAVNGIAIEGIGDFYKALNEKSSVELWFDVNRAGNKLETMRYKR
ncbi:MAG: Do family serine endopeptidase [Treponemataceae bacterium]